MDSFSLLDCCFRLGSELDWPPRGAGLLARPASTPLERLLFVACECCSWLSRLGLLPCCAGTGLNALLCACVVFS